MKPNESNKIISSHYEPASGTYEGKDVKGGIYILQAEADNLKSEERQIKVDPIYRLKDIVILGKEGQAFYYRGNVRVPFEPRNDLIAVSIRPVAEVNALDRASNLNLEQQWHLFTINAPTAWSMLANMDHNITFGSSNIVIAVMDEGIDSRHPDLNGNLANGISKIYRTLLLWSLCVIIMTQAIISITIKESQN